MKSVAKYFGLVVLCLCLSLYAAVAGADGHGTEMVICADGGAKTVYLDASGAPMEPGEKCCTCLDCNAPNLIAILPSLPSLAANMPRPMTAIVEPMAEPFVPTHARPMPRGPPPAQATGCTIACRMVFPVTFDIAKVSLGDCSHCGGADLQGSPT